jgi:hypothetical protein
MRRILFVGIAALTAISTVAEARDGCGSRPHVTTSRPGRSCGLISAGETRRDIPRQIQPLRRGTTARRISQFRTACVSHTEGARPSGLCRPKAAVMHCQTPTTCRFQPRGKRWQPKRSPRSRPSCSSSKTT